MITADPLPTFPHCPTYGFAVDPTILVKIVAREGGFESVTRKWAHPLRRFNGVPIGDSPEEDVERILYFWLAMGGTAGIFRFKDWTDYKSCLLADQPAAIDQPLVVNADSPGGYQLLKQYVFGSLTYERPITRPIGETILIANEVGAVQPGSSYTLDAATGLLAINGGFTGTPTSWGGEFDVRARFDGAFVPQISNFKIQRADVSIIEKREP